jgi:hypothetical protein
MLNFNKISFFFNSLLNSRKTKYFVPEIEAQVASSTNYEASRYHIKKSINSVYRIYSEISPWAYF